MPKTQRLNTGRSAEFADSAGGNAASLDIAAIALTTGVTFTGNKVNGTTINFTTGRSGVSFFATSAYISGNHPLPSDSLGVNVDGIDYTLGVFAINNGSGGDTVFDVPFGGSIGIPLAPGNHVAYVIATQANIGFLAAPGSPLTLTVIFPTVAGDVATASPIAAQQVENVTGTPLSNNTGTYALVPGTLINLSFAGTQTVFFEGLGSVLNSTTPDANGFNGQLGIRIDGIDYSGDATAWDSIYVHYGAPAVAHKAIVLTAGAHTAQLVFRQANSGGREGRLANSTTFPTRLTALYTVPQAVSPGGEAVAEDDSASDTTASDVFVDTGASVTFSLSESSVVKADAYAIVNPTGGGADVTNAQLGLNIDGTDYAGTAWAKNDNTTIAFYGNVTAHKDIVLAAGSHTITARFRRYVALQSASLSDTHLSVVYKV
jgi:hypothetical protein